jgi:hypothetical protein
VDHLGSFGRALITGIAALLLAALGVATVFLPPFPAPAWFASAFTVGPVERLWYSLPDAQRQDWLYNVGVTAAEAVYPALLAASFWLWTRPLRRGLAIPWPRSAVFIVLGALASLAWYLVGWHWGIEYQGQSTVISYLVIDIVWLGLTAACIRFSTTYASWWASLAAHFALFMWVVTIAFPWLGEMI